MRFRDLYVSKDPRFTIGIELETQKYYISTMTYSGMADLIEYYEIEKEDFDKVFTDLDHLKKLVQKCKDHKNDSRLMHPYPRAP